MSRRRSWYATGRFPGIILLILAVAHVPLPRAEYHSVSHHDGPNQVCELHQHLLRWHPTAGPGEMVAVLHWHWFLPQRSHHDEPGPADHGGDPGDPAPLAFEDDLTIGDDAPPSLTLDALPRSHERPVVAPSCLLAGLLPPLLLDTGGPPRPSLSAREAGIAPPVRPSSRFAQLQRWTC